METAVVIVTKIIINKFLWKDSESRVTTISLIIFPTNQGLKRSEPAAKIRHIKADKMMCKSGTDSDKSRPMASIDPIDLFQSGFSSFISGSVSFSFKSSARTIHESEMRSFNMIWSELNIIYLYNNYCYPSYLAYRP